MLVVALVVAGYFYFVAPLNSITRVDVGILNKVTKPGGPFTVLVTGSDSRAFVKTNGPVQVLRVRVADGRPAQ